MEEMTSGIVIIAHTGMEMYIRWMRMEGSNLSMREAVARLERITAHMLRIRHRFRRSNPNMNAVRDAHME